MCKIRFCFTHVCAALSTSLKSIHPVPPKVSHKASFTPGLLTDEQPASPDSSNGFSTRSIYWNWSRAAFKSHRDNQRHNLAVKSGGLEVFAHSNFFEAAEKPPLKTFWVFFFLLMSFFTHPISEWYKCDHALYGKPFKWHFSKFYSQQTNSTPPTLYHDHTVINTQYNNNSN